MTFDDKAVGVWATNNVGAVPLPDPRWDDVTKEFEILAGSGFSISINKAGVTNAFAVSEEDMVNEFGMRLNAEGIVPILYGESAKTNAAVTSGTLANAYWSAMPISTATILPQFSW